MSTSEALLLRIMGILAEKYKNQLVLKGGMLLRLLNSPRQTQDIDYCWVQTKKRKFFAEDIAHTLKAIDGLEVTGVECNSRGIFIEVRERASRQLAKIEITIEEARARPPEPMTTAVLAHRYALRTQVLATMPLAEAFSHKIATALERDLIRDLYDLMQLEALTPFDPSVLEERISRLEIGRKKPRAYTINEAAHLLRKKMDSLTSKDIEEELGATLPPEHLVGLTTILRASLTRVLQRMGK